MQKKSKLTRTKFYHNMLEIFHSYSKFQYVRNTKKDVKLPNMHFNRIIKLELQLIKLYIKNMDSIGKKRECFLIDLSSKLLQLSHNKGSKTSFFCM